jgi:transposase
MVIPRIIAAASLELSAPPRRRKFTAKEKLRILAEIDRATGIPGAIGAIMRREGLYSSTITDWRRQREAGAYEGLSPVKRAPKPVAVHPLPAEHVQLQRAYERLEKRLERAEAVIDIQKTRAFAGPPDRGRREVLMAELAALKPDCVMLAAACDALGMSRATFHRRQVAAVRPPVGRSPRPTPARALPKPERQRVIALLREPQYVDLAPAEIYATLLDQGIYHCSIRTMYRILHESIGEPALQLAAQEPGSQTIAHRQPTTMASNSANAAQRVRRPMDKHSGDHDSRRSLLVSTESVAGLAAGY